MIELIDTLPDVNVQPAEYKRLLGFPRDHVLTGRARDLAEWARSWYARNGRPWVYARHVDQLAVAEGSVAIDGVTFRSTRLAKTLRDADAHAAILVAVSAGPEIESAAARLWFEEKPDEYFFLEIFGSAVVEHLTTTTGARLCGWADNQSMAVLPHYSPGYQEWDITEQSALLDVLRRGAKQPLPGQIEVLDSGMLRPKKSLLAVFGLTRQVDRVRRLTDLVPCENCSFSPCQFRRAPYRRALAAVESVAARLEEVSEPQREEAPLPIAPLDPAAKYSTNRKALARWANDRLSLKFNADGTIDALFRYEGSTCSNMGRTFTFHYTVKLGPREDGYPIREQLCAPAPGDEGHRFMCRFMSNAEHLMVAIDHEKPLLGQKLNEVLAWQRPLMAPSCYCEPTSRKHKWGLVFETIHYALCEREKQSIKPQVTIEPVVMAEASVMR